MYQVEVQQPAEISKLKSHLLYQRPLITAKVLRKVLKMHPLSDCRIIVGVFGSSLQDFTIFYLKVQRTNFSRVLLILFLPEVVFPALPLVFNMSNNNLLVFT